MRSAWAVALKELRQIRRDQRSLVILIFLPTFFLFLYGYALNFDVRHVAIAVDDRDLSAASRQLVASLVRSTYFDVVAHISTEADASAVIDRGQVRAVLVIPSDFSRRIHEHEPAEVQVIVDGDNANTATTVLGYLNAVLREAAVTLGDRPVVSLAAVEPRIRYNPELRSTVFLVPGLIAFISMITAVVSTALSIVREIERGTMEQVRMSPISTLSFVVGKTLPYLVMSQIGAVAILVAAMFFFDLPMRGSWGPLLLVVALFLVGALGTGLLVSTLADTQQVAFQAAALVAMLPTLILSGFIFPIASMPTALQYISAIVPARYFLIALRGIVLKGLDLGALGSPILALVIYAAVMLGLSAWTIGTTMRRRIATLIWKEFIELVKSPQLLRIVIIAPVVQLTLLGYAATTDVKDVPIVVVDGDRSAASRRLMERFAASPYFDIVREEIDPRAVDADLAQGTAWLAVIVPAGFGDDLERPPTRGGRRATVQVIADGTDANSSGVALAYVQGLVGEFNAAIATEHGAALPVIDGRVRVWFNADLESRNFMIPGVLALLLMLVTANLASMAIVREREVGTLDQLNVTPLGRWELILGKLLPYALVGFLDVLLVVTVAVFWFAVPLRGSVPLLLAASLVYLLCTLGLGLFVSTISSTQQQAMMTSTFFFLIPMVYLSGFIFPIENMPRVIQHLTTLIPLRYFLVIVRGIFLKGVGFDVLWPQFAALGAWGVAVLGLAAARSRKRA